MPKPLAAGGFPGEDFEILGLIATPEAAATAAPYLFDSRIVVMNNGASWDNFCGAAEMALEAMKFPDAPKLPIPTPSWRLSLLGRSGQS